MNLRVLFNYILVRIGCRSILPAEIIRRKKVKDNKESLALLMSPNIVYAGDASEQFARQSVVNKLERIAQMIQDQGYKLLIYELYRNPSKQLQKREEYFSTLKTQNPKLSEDEILRIVNRCVANVGGGHQTGGAVDLTLCDMNGTPIDMGNNYLDFKEETKTDSKMISLEQRNNRDKLLKVMQSEGFNNYPAEWWHYSFGDKMWAAYKNKTYAIYDTVPNPTKK